MVTQEQLKQMFEYENGQLIYKINPKGRSKKGDSAGTIQPNGYTQVMISGKRYYLHRLIWMYHNGSLPSFIDHVNRDKSDNRIENLRIADKLLNSWKSDTSTTTSQTGYKGVCYMMVRNKYLAYAYHKKQFVFIGHYDTDVDAARAYNEKVLELRGEYAVLNDVPEWL